MPKLAAPWVGFSALAAVVAAALGACTPMRWEHPQLGTAAVEKDALDCDSRARREWARYDHIYDLHGFCMRSKGYRSVPVR